MFAREKAEQPQPGGFGGNLGPNGEKVEGKIKATQKINVAPMKRV